MDRLERYFPPSVAVPLAVLALAGAVGMVLLTAGRPRLLDARPSRLPPLMRTCRLKPADRPPVLAPVRRPYASQRLVPAAYPATPPGSPFSPRPEGPTLEGPRMTGPISPRPAASASAEREPANDRLAPPPADYPVTRRTPTPPLAPSYPATRRMSGPSPVVSSPVSSSVPAPLPPSLDARPAWEAMPHPAEIGPIAAPQPPVGQWDAPPQDVTPQDVAPRVVPQQDVSQQGVAPQVMSQPFVPPGVRSSRLEEFARQADAHTRRGYELAGRKAQHSARSEFVQALRIVAQGLDMERGTSAHSEALRAGLTAIDESQDFLPVGSRLEAELDVAGLITGHRTWVLKSSGTPAAVEAMRRYLTFAQEQLSLAAGGEVAGSMALHALGKLAAAEQGDAARLGGPRAVTFYQAALIACPNNAMASNDLGVLLARAGHLQQAEAMLQHSVALAPASATRRNLAVVQQRLGQTAAAQRAPVPSVSNGMEPAGPSVQWVSPAQFAQSFAQTPDVRQPLPARQTQAPVANAATRPAADPTTPPTATTKSDSSSSSRTAGSWLPTWFHPTRK